jgi:hypothetical protein
MTIPFKKSDINTTEKAVHYAQTSSIEDFTIFADWFTKGCEIWILPEGHKDSVLQAINERKNNE